MEASFRELHQKDVLLAAVLRYPSSLNQSDFYAPCSLLSQRRDIFLVGSLLWIFGNQKNIFADPLDKSYGYAIICNR
jgi:hypothetical protein